ncbi:MAG: hypothetical protein GWN67_11015 [Phycisphaerae bacterium]|nr:hypothetical protein [Phycisphaerae bacterium]NIP56073.1 hypothetical protein [Phycisphaerae bacterium]NIS51633.1 hypothetical protein [Phycisphaerae bacterium]NIU09227.1 hypothetical protein [Phycisphaerae bacterium]NIU56888.1 hypothetical protein [Phycisphaerae bacterium]
MKRETIERLAVDSAAGELNEDILALFEAYLAEHPQAGRWAEDMAGIYKETEAAIDAKTGSADADGDVPAIKVKPVLRARWLVIGRAAAALIVAAVIGFTGGRWTINGEAGRITLMTSGRPAEQVKTVSDLKEEYAGTFWGKKVLALMEHTSSERYKAGFQDTSLWQIYRQYIKEKPDE